MFFHILRFLASLGMTALFVFLVLARHLVAVQLLAIVMPRQVIPPSVLSFRTPKG